MELINSRKLSKGRVKRIDNDNIKRIKNVIEI